MFSRKSHSVQQIDFEQGPGLFYLCMRYIKVFDYIFKVFLPSDDYFLYQGTPKHVSLSLKNNELE